MQLKQLIILIFFTLMFSACSSESDSVFIDTSVDNTTIEISGLDATINQNAVNGTVIGNIEVIKEGIYAIEEMRLYGISAPYFDIDVNGTITLASAADLNMTYKTLYELEVIATNETEKSNRGAVNIRVVNSDIPRLESLNINVDENITTGIAIGNITILDTGSSSIDSIVLTGEGANSFSVDTDGVIRLNTSLDFAAKNLYTLEAIATNTNGSSVPVDVIISVNNINNPVSGIELPLVLIAISFNDYPIRDSELNWSQKIFGTSYGQVNHYYREVSNERFSIVPAVETSGTSNDGVVKVSLNINHPGNNDMGKSHLVEAVNLADSYIDFSQYDTNGNNNIEVDELQIMFIVGGGETAYGDPVSSSTWAHASGLYAGWGDAPPLVDGVTVMAYFEDGKYSRFGEKQGNHFATIGVIVHELGHSIWGLPDLYDRDQSSGGIGYFGLMASGSWGAKSDEHGGATPPHMCAWSKLELNWINPQVVTATTNNITMNATHLNSNNILKITTDDPNQYFLVENRSPVGYDAGLYKLDYVDFSGGIAIWHIDEIQRASQNDDETHKLVDLEEANSAELDSGGDGTITNLFYSANRTSFTDSAKYDGSVTGVVIDNISIVGDAGNEYIMYVDVTK